MSQTTPPVERGGASWRASVLALCGGRRWDEVPRLVLAAVEELMADAAKSA